MKYHLLDLLCCTSCGDQLTLHPFKERAAESGNAAQSIRAPQCGIYCGLQNISIKGNDAGAEQPAFDCAACYKREIVEGILSCACGSVFPVSSGVPCMLDGGLEAHPEFVAENRDKLAGLTGDKGKKVKKASAQPPKK